MATTNDIDTKAAVRKFLESRSVIDREDEVADSADEVQAILESVALSFLLYPQSALSFVLNAKNVLQQVVTTDLEIVDYLLKAISDIENPDEPITDVSDLIEAQTALVEVDRIGRVSNDLKSYDRYNQAIQRFLDRRLAKFVKRRKRGELERTGIEAKQDLFRVLALFEPTHDLLITRLGLLLAGVSNFQSIDLTRIVSTRTLTRVRASLKKVIQALEKQQLSKTAATIELLSGSAALSSISNSRKVYDPTVETGSFPIGRSISISSERVGAKATGSSETISLGAFVTPWVFDATVDPEAGSGTNYQVTLPYPGASNRSYVKANQGTPTYNIPVGTNTIYVQFDGIAPPANEPVMVRTVTLPTGGAVALVDILTALNDISTGLIDGTAVEMAPGTGRILIYGSASVTRIVVRANIPGTFDGLGNYSPAPNSAHIILGFSNDQQSGPPDLFSPAELVDLLSPRLVLATVSVVEGATQIASNSTDLLSSLSFGPGVASNFGFSGTYKSKPSYLELIEGEDPIDPTTVGVFAGSMISAVDVNGDSSRTLFEPVLSIDGTHLLFDSLVTLPRCDQGEVRIVSPIVFAVQQLLDLIRPVTSEFGDDNRDLQRVLSPLLSKPTLAQINDAKRVLQAIRTKVNDLLTNISAVVVRDDRTEFGAVASRITASLEERGLDRGLELLQGCQFSEFFTMTREEASKGSRFLKASEQVGRNEFAKTTVEQDIDDLEPLGSTPDEDILTGEELMEDEEPL